MIELRRLKFNFDNIDELSLLDPKLIISLTVFPQEVRVISLNRLFPLQKKITILLGETSWMTGGIKIKSVQHLSTGDNTGFLIIETDGPMCLSTKIVAEKILESMQYIDVRDAFFPGEDVLKSQNDISLFYYGQDIDNLKLADSFFTTVRLVDNYLIFYCQKEKMIKKMRLGDVVLDWSANSFGLCNLDNVVFLGRVKDNIMPITLRDGRVLNMDVFQGSIVSEGRALEDIGIFIGEVGGVNASMIADKLIFSQIERD